MSQHLLLKTTSGLNNYFASNQLQDGSLFNGFLYSFSGVDLNWCMYGNTNEDPQDQKGQIKNNKMLQNNVYKSTM